MIRWQIVVVAIVLARALPAGAQGFVPPNPALPQLPNPATGYGAAPAASAPPTAPGATATPANPYARNPEGPTAPNPTEAYGTNPTNYASTPEGTKQRHATAQERAAERQSGLDAAQAKTLLEEKGYRSITGVRPDPNSSWVWRAEVMRDGRPTQVGIDYRGHVLDLSSTQAKPCTGPGVRPGAIAGAAVGAQLTEADSCSGR